MSKKISKEKKEQSKDGVVHSIAIDMLRM